MPRQPRSGTNSVAAAGFHISAWRLRGAGSPTSRSPSAAAASFAWTGLPRRPTQGSGTHFLGFLYHQTFYSLHRSSQTRSCTDYHLSSDSGQPVTKARQELMGEGIQHFGDDFRHSEFLPQALTCEMNHMKKKCAPGPKC